MLAVAVIVTDVPEQMVVPGLAAMLTVGVRFGLTTIVNPLEVAVVAVKQVTRNRNITGNHITIGKA